MPAIDTTRPVEKKKRRRLSPQEREHQIITGAIDFVSTNGLGFSTRDLANHLDISQALLFRYFQSKDDLLEKIYERVYLGRWNPEWEDMIRDRSLSVRERLKNYLLDYAKVVLQRDWVRIFMFSAFDNPVISQRYTSLLRRRIFEPILEEQLHALGLAECKTPQEKELALEMIWGFHSSIFYMGVREWVYKVPCGVPAEDVIRERVHIFLDGFEAYLGRHCQKISAT